MLRVPAGLQARFERGMAEVEVERAERGEYVKWVRFYLDFCDKYGHADASPASLPLFLAKLASKHQSPARQQQASCAVGLY